MRARRTEELKDDRSEGIDVNLMDSDTPMFNFFEKLLRMKLNKAELRENLTEYKSPRVKRMRKQKAKCACKNTNVIRNVEGKKSQSGNAAVTATF